MCSVGERRGFLFSLSAVRAWDYCTTHIILRKTHHLFIRHIHMEMAIGEIGKYSDELIK